MTIQKSTTTGNLGGSDPLQPEGGPKLPPRNSAALVWLWVLQGLLAATFLLTGLMKLAGHPIPVALFEKVGVGQWLRFVTGAIEVLGGVLVLFPRLASGVAALLACTMVGAIVSHLTKVGGSPAPAIVLLFLCLVVAWKRRSYFLRHEPRIER